MVAKYLVVDEEDVQFNLLNDDQMTLVTATFPLNGQRVAAGAVGAAVQMAEPVSRALDSATYTNPPQ